MVSIKKRTSWNKGIKGSESHMFGNKNFLGKIPWNKGKKCPNISETLKGREMSKEVRKKISVARKGHLVSKGTREKISLSHKGMQFSSKHKLNISRVLKSKKRTSFYKKIGLIGIKAQQSSKEPTSIEKKVYDELKERGFLFENQKVINGKFIVDAYIPKLNLIVEVDGKYWHSLERVVKKDKAENAYLKKCGFNLLRLDENEVNDGKFKERLPLWIK